MLEAPFNWILGLSCLALVLLPLLTYLCIKMGTWGYLNAIRQYNKQIQEETDNNKNDPASTERKIQ